MASLERSLQHHPLVDLVLLDALIAVGRYRATSMAINSAGIQLDANMADFRFPESLR